MSKPVTVSELPAVLFDDDICRALRISLTTLKRLRRAGAFPIPELPSLDKRHRYSPRDLEAYLARQHGPVLVRRRVGGR
jgi:predicted site-specific integrase-resolvase